MRRRQEKTSKKGKEAVRVMPSSSVEKGLLRPLFLMSVTVPGIRFIDAGVLVVVRR